jgi:hypothetical protein
MTDKYPQEARQLPLYQLNATEDEVTFTLSSAAHQQIFVVRSGVSCMTIQWWLAILLLTKKQKQVLLWSWYASSKCWGIGLGHINEQVPPRFLDSQHTIACNFLSQSSAAMTLSLDFITLYYSIDRVGHVLIVSLGRVERSSLVSVFFPLELFCHEHLLPRGHLQAFL